MIGKLISQASCAIAKAPIAFSAGRRCPRYPDIFPELRVDDRTKTLFANFKAFRFPSTARVNFVATVRFCQDRCLPVSANRECMQYIH